MMLNASDIFMLITLVEDKQIKLTNKGETHILESLHALLQKADDKVFKAKRERDIVCELQEKFDSVV